MNQSRGSVVLAAATIVLVGIAFGAPTPAAGQCGSSYTVTGGDTLWGIARECGTSIGALRRANPDVGADAVIYVGQTLQMPGADEPAGGDRPAGEAPDRSGTYTVESGDTLSAIAQRFGIALDRILEANPDIEDAARIFIGQVLVLPGADGELPEPPAGRRADVTISPHRGPVGTGVTVRAEGYEPGRSVRVGMGPPASEYEVLRQLEVGPDGTVQATVSVPSWADPGDHMVFVVDAGPAGAKAVSETFHVTAGDTGDGDGREMMEVTGRLTDEGVECPALRGDDGTLYTLTGADLSRYSSGDRVTIRGTVAEMSICMQGTTLAVRDVHPVDG